MSWLVRSIATSLQPPEPSPPVVMAEAESPSEPIASTSTPAQGVREDLSDLSKTFSRHFKGVASFLAPPPLSDPDPSAEVGDPDSPSIPGFDISKIASSFLQLKSEDESEEEEEVGVSGDEGFDVIGVTDEVLAFARNISMHPETWLDFPLLPDEDEPDSLFSYFEMSEAQIEHAMTMERVAPRLAALRIELCPIHMSQDCFWKIYFVLLHPRLNKHDADLLSTPQIVEARAMLMQSLQTKTKSETEENKYNNHNNTQFVHDSSVFPSTDLDADKDYAGSNEMQVVDKCVIKEDFISDSQHNLAQRFEEENDSDDDFFNKEPDLQEGISMMHLGANEDVSFSDLEDDEFYTK